MRSGECLTTLNLCCPTLFQDVEQVLIHRPTTLEEQIAPIEEWKIAGKAKEMGSPEIEEGGPFCGNPIGEFKERRIPQGYAHPPTSKCGVSLGENTAKLNPQLDELMFHVEHIPVQEAASECWLTFQQCLGILPHQLDPQRTLPRRERTKSNPVKPSQGSTTAPLENQRRLVR